ncbi:diguanylate cyclase/phosphodiesterase (GGDEF & EAL domains) with PAS/PAC sensor(s) [hydrothermal vent metagenome]|uniref:Diguanylate cyclase/phosphodiesterase (GGDEF & EAL domains) with PAS/PAC sensor(S) n=1 Tax=hydrothermal vent metagenome TaxID=652676 RepID=A0A3B1BUA4_9ZZZZ
MLKLRARNPLRYNVILSENVIKGENRLLRATEFLNRLSVRINILIILLIFVPTGIIVNHYRAKLDRDLKTEILGKVAAQLHERAEKASFALNFAASGIDVALKHINIFLSADIKDTMSLAENIPSPSFYESDFYSHLATDLRTEMEANDHYMSLRLINAIGHEVVRVERKDGRILEVPYQNLQNKSGRDYFKLAMKSRSAGAFISPPSLNKEKGLLSVPHTLTFRVAKKVVLKNGEVVGVIVLNVDARMLFGSITSDPGSGFLVIEEDGTYLHHWDEKLLFGKDLGHGANLLTDEPELRANLKKQDSMIHWDGQLKEYRVWRKIFYNSGDNDRYMVFMIRIPESQVAASWALTIEKGMFALIFAAGLSLLLIFFAMKLQLRPLNTLLASIGKLEKGDLKERAELKTKTEIGTIGSAFNKMAEKLENMTGLARLQQEIAISANEASTINEAMRACLERVCGYTGWEVGHFFALDESGALVTSGVWVASDTELIKPLVKATNLMAFKPGEGLPGQAFERGESLWFANVDDDPRYPRSKILMEIGFNAGLAFPVLEGKKVTAVLEFFTTQGKEPDALMIEAVKNLGALLGRVTERKRVEDALRESEERLRKLSEAAFEGIVFLEKGRILECNNTFAKMVGYSRDELIGIPVINLIAPEDTTIVSENIAKGYEGVYETNALRKDGSTFRIEAHGMSTLYQGRPARVTAIRDITERRRAEDDLRESEENLRDITSTIGQGVIVTDTDLTITFANPEAARLLGWGEDEMLGENAHTKFHYLNPDGSPYLYEKCVALNSVSAGLDFFDVEDAFVKQDGTIFPISLTSTCIKKEGEVTGAVLAFYDITERTRIQEKLQLASMVVNTAIEGVVVTDVDTVIQSVNPAFTHITGYSAKEAIGQKPNMLRSDRHDKEFYKKMWEAILKTGQWQGEIWNRRKNGEVFPERLSITAIKDSKNNIVKYASVFYDITELKQSEKEVEYKAYHDALTGLPNRQLFQDRLEQAIVRARRADSMLAVLFIDLDDFKNVNDSLGHASGDLLLQGIAVRLVGCAREEDTISRLGGDEFTIIIENIDDEQEAANVAERVIASLSEPFNYKNDNLYAAVSIGIAVYPANGATLEELIKNADIAMYNVKNKGKNNYSFFTSEMNEKAVRRIELTRNLRQAIGKDELKAYYQPKIDMETSEIVGMEALIRWIRPDGIVYPDEFIPVAEDTGLIVDLDEWMFCAACAFIKKIEERSVCLGKKNDVKVSINFSAKDIEKPNLINNVRNIIVGHGIDPERLEIEVTESAIIRDIDRAVDILADLREIGLGISIDDFGTGYSSLNYLTKLPINALKIDRAFIVDIEEDRNARTVAKAITAMASELGLTVIAEGVETRAQYEFLYSIGCDQVQGYIFSKPVPEDEMLKMLEEGKTLQVT